MAYPKGLLKRVVAAKDRGLGTQRVAELFGVPGSWVRRLKQWQRERGDIAPRAYGGSSPKLGSAAQGLIHTHFAAHPDTTIVDVGEVTAWGAERRLGYRFKKTIHAAEQERPDVIERRQAWTRDTEGVDPSRLIFIDESGAKTNMTRRYGWGLGGGRVVEAVPVLVV